MYSIGKLVNGEFKQVAGNYDILNAPNATETTAGFLSPADKQKLDKSYTTDDVASKEEIAGLFNN